MWLQKEYPALDKMALGLQRSWADLLIQENIVYLFGFVVFLGGIGGLIFFLLVLFACIPGAWKGMIELGTKQLTLSNLVQNP